MALDLMSALGAPEDGDEPAAPGAPPAPAGKPSLLDKEDPVTQQHLLDAVDDSLDPQSRAEALCRAIKSYVEGGGGVTDEAEEAPEPEEEGLGGEY
jgi:hypothetical protein